MDVQEYAFILILQLQLKLKDGEQIFFFNFS